MNTTATPDNTLRFSGRADVYDRYRQRYPTEDVLAHLHQWCGLTPDWRIADIGAGTGMLAEVFLANGNRITAVEPNADMRQKMHEAFADETKLEIVDAAAEATTLAPATFEMVAAGRAFHWFDRDRALAEFRRILVPRGWVVLVSLGRAHHPTDPAFLEQSAALEHLLTELGTDYRYIRGNYRVHDNLQPLFAGEFHQEQLPGTQQLDWEALHGQFMSISVAPQPGHPNYEAFQRELRRLFDEHAVDGVITMPTTCYITAGRLDP